MGEATLRQQPIPRYVVHAMVMALSLIKLQDIKEFVLHVVIHAQRAEDLDWQWIIYGNMINCVYCGGTGRKQNNSGNGSNISFGARTTKFVKTNAMCNECSCSGYWGIKHDSGAYEGDCQNTDQWGHRCGHSPKHHGLKQY